MNASPRSHTLAALACVLTVQAVPGFAQTNTVAYTDALHTSTTAAREYVATRSAAYDGVGRAPNLTVTSLYESVVATMLERSPTFRRQLARIAQATTLEIEIRCEPRGVRSTLAWTTILRRNNGAGLHAIVHVVPGARAVELIAHEIEHVIEQLDGVDLRHKASMRATGVRVCACGDGEMYETRRAIAVGRQVIREVQDAASRGE